MAIFLSTPGQAARIFQGDSLPRTKDLFVVHFTAIEGGDGGDQDWRRRLTFMVKSIDRPQVQPTVEEINQYNKRRQIQTGIKYGNIRMTLYETRNNLAGRMWVQYKRHYFGDQAHGSQNWRYDVTSAEFLKSSVVREFGFSPRTFIQDPSRESFFFEKIDIYEVEGTDYVQTTLVNPKIASYDPEDLDYANSEVNTVSMSIAYETILYRHGGVQRPVATNGFLQSVFCENDFRQRHATVRTFTDIVEPMRARPEPADSEETTANVPNGIANPDRPRGDPLVRTPNTPSAENAEVGRTGSYSSDYGAAVPTTSRGADHQSHDVLAARASTTPFGNDYAADALAASRATQTPATTQITRTRDGVSLSDEAVASANARSSPTTQIGLRETADATFANMDAAFEAVDRFGADAVEYFSQRAAATGLSPEQVRDEAIAATRTPITPANQARTIAQDQARVQNEIELTRDMGLAFAASESRNIEQSGFSRDLAFRAANEQATRSFGDHRTLQRPSENITVVSTGSETTSEQVERSGGRLVNTGTRLNQYFADRVRELEERYRPK